MSAFDQATGRMEVNVYGGGSGTTPTPSLPVGNGSVATAQVTVPATAGGILLAALRSTRGAITIVNHGTTAVYIGGSAVTAADGVLLPGVLGANITLPTTASVYAITASGTQVVSVVETFG